MAIQLDTIEALKAKMKEAPEVSKEKRHVSKQEAIRELKRDIDAMQKRGYTLDDIAKFLSDGGLQITTPTLKSYLQRSKSDKTKSSKAETKKSENFSDEKKKDDVKAKDQVVVEKAKTVVENKQPQTENKGGFEVRPDSDI